MTFDSNGGSAVSSQTVDSGSTAAEPTAPARDGYTFVGWYNGSAEYCFDMPVTSNLTLTAKWT
ncbi:MAG: InlB B-repeat-containing protein [Clostridiales bacterium]|nr:InlB B-repeat-containing protein [Clostridiales bacterium]